MDVGVYPIAGLLDDGGPRWMRPDVVTFEHLIEESWLHDVYRLWLHVDIYIMWKIIKYHRWKCWFGSLWHWSWGALGHIRTFHSRRIDLEWMELVVFVQSGLYFRFSCALWYRPWTSACSFSDLRYHPLFPHFVLDYCLLHRVLCIDARSVGGINFLFSSSLPSLLFLCYGNEGKSLACSVDVAFSRLPHPCLNIEIVILMLGGLIAEVWSILTSPSTFVRYASSRNHLLFFALFQGILIYVLKYIQSFSGVFMINPMDLRNHSGVLDQHYLLWRMLFKRNCLM